MSVNYEITEHLVMKKDCGAAAVINEIMRGQLSLLGARMLVDRAEIIKAEVKTNANELVFGDNVSITDLKTFIDAISGILNDSWDVSSDLDLYIHYKFTHYDGDEGPLAMTIYLNALDDESLAGVFYTMYSWMDCSDDSGNIFAYGMKDDGTCLRGKIDYIPVDSMPQDGTWYNRLESVMYQQDCMEGEDIPDNILLKGPADIEKFVMLIGEFIRLAGKDVITQTEFADVYVKDPRMLRIDFDKNGKASYYIAEA